MRGEYRVVDTERHVVEPRHLWERYLDPKFASQAPQWVSDGSLATKVGGVAMIQGGPEIALLSEPSPEFRDNGSSANLADMDKEGVDVAILFPSAGLSVIWGDHVAPVLAAALCRAYNNWLAEYCRADANRLKGLALIPLQDPDEAVGELRRSIKDLGMVGAFVRPNPLHKRQLNDRAYWALYKEAQDLGVPICVHSAAGSILAEIGVKDMTGLEHPEGVQRFEGQFARAAISYPLEIMGAALSFAGEEPMMEFPGLKVHFASAGCGWLFFWIERMDDEWANRGNDAITKFKPGWYFARQGLVAAYAHEQMIPYVAEEFLGNLAWGSGYPHPALRDFPKELDPLVNHAHLSADEKRKILWENAATTFNLT